MFSSLILTESIWLSFVPKTLIYLQRNSLDMFVKLNGTMMYLFLIMIQLGLLPFNWYLFFNHWVDTHLKPVNIFCELWQTRNFDFPYQTYPFLIKYVQLNAPDVNFEKRLTNDKYNVWQNLKTRGSVPHGEVVLG